MGKGSLFEMGSEQLRQLGSYSVCLGNSALPVVMNISEHMLESSGREDGRRNVGMCHGGLDARLRGWPLSIGDRVFVGIFDLEVPDQTCALGRLMCLRWGVDHWALWMGRERPTGGLPGLKQQLI